MARQAEVGLGGGSTEPPGSGGGSTEPPAADPVGDSAGLPEILVSWENAPETVEQLDSLTFLVGSLADETKEVNVWARVDGLGIGPLDVGLGAVQLAPQSVEAFTVDIDTLPLQSINRSITLLLFASFDRDTQPSFTTSAAPLAYHFRPGYRKALVYPHDVMVMDLEGGWLVPSPPMTTGRVLTEQGFVSLAAYLAQTGELPIVDTPRVIPRPAPKLPTEQAASPEDIDPQCIVAPWECCTGDNCIDICADWTTTYVDTNQGEDYGLGVGTQHIEASYARYEIQRRFCNGYFCTYFNTGEQGYLGPDGCALNDLAPWKSHRIRVYTEHERPLATGVEVRYHPTNDLDYTVGTIAVSTSFTAADKDVIGPPPTGLPKTRVQLPFHAATNGAAMASRGLASGLFRQQSEDKIIRAGLGCNSGSSETCARGRVLYTGTYTNVVLVNGFPFASPGDLRWKFVLGHELGHVVQNGATGTPSSPYCWNSAGDAVDSDGLECEPGDTPDPLEPGLSALCKCDHVSTLNTNNLHCLQSRELSSAAQTEGFGHFAASRFWNDASGSDCTFAYYKHFLEPSGEIKKPPYQADCLEPVLWRDNHCHDEYSGTEYDWMQFYYRVTKPGSPVSLDDVFDVYQLACFDNDDLCDTQRVTWSDLKFAAQSSLGIAATNAFLAAASTHGVNEAQNLP